jgi:hypothetical protein
MSRPEFPVFNHVAMSVERSLLEPEGRAELLDFYGEVFGWGEMPTMSIDGERLVMRAHSNEQFIFLVADENPMRCPATDHFGLSVRTPEELYATLERARKFKERDPRVVIDEPMIEDHKVLKLHNFYVRYLLPLTIELQCFDWAEGLGADSFPD